MDSLRFYLNTALQNDANTTFSLIKLLMKAIKGKKKIALICLIEIFKSRSFGQLLFFVFFYI